MRGVKRTTVDDVLAAARARLDRVTPAQAWARMMHAATLVDVRTTDQVRAGGHIPGALEISLNVLEWRLDPESPSRHPDAPALDDAVIVLCQQGYSSSLAAARLRDIGFVKATDVIGGFEAWVDEGLPRA